MNTKRIALFCLSGTGNTLMLSSMLNKFFSESGMDIDSYRIEDYIKNGDIPNISDYDMIGIGYPIHAFNVPMPLLNSIRKFPYIQGKKVFIFKSSGEPFAPNNSSSYMLCHLLSNKGYNIIFERHFLMPYNIMFRYPESLVKQMVLTNELLAEGMVKSILKGRICTFNYKLRQRAFSFALRYVLHYGTIINGKLFRANKNCSNCGKCINDCPVKNITEKNGRIKFGWKCFLCMRCVFRCPNNAIHIGLLDLWALRGEYEFERILTDESISSSYVNENTKSYFRLFRKYYREADNIISEELKSENNDDNEIDKAQANQYIV